MSKADIEKIRQLNSQWVSAVNAGDLAAWQKTFTGDFVWMPPDMPKLSGKKAVTQFAKTAFFDPYKVKLTQRLGKVEVFGPRALASSSFQLELTPKGGGETKKGVGKFMFVCLKDKGSWKLTQAIWNLDKPLA